MENAKRRRCLHSQSCICTSTHLTVEVLLLVFRSQNWNPFLIASMSQVCRWFSEIAKLYLWKSFCITRSPKMVADIAPPGTFYVTRIPKMVTDINPLSGGGRVPIEVSLHSIEVSLDLDSWESICRLLILGSRTPIDGGWDSLGRLLIYCAGCQESRHICSSLIRGHFVRTTRFSKTSGRSFLLPECRSDVLYISDPCEHPGMNGDDDTGLFRGAFKAFLKSSTRRLLVDLGVEFEPKERCPYCFTRVWSLLHANMIPKSAHRRLGAHRDVEYFVCLNGHVHGRCSLLHLSDSEASSEDY